MAPKVDRFGRTRAAKAISSNHQGISDLAPIQEAITSNTDPSKLSVSGLLNYVLEVNKDPNVESLLLMLSEKISREAFANYLESEIRSRSIVVTGIEEAPDDSLPSERQADVERKVSKILDIVKVECRPEKVLRMGKPNPSRPRLVK
ncbi:hypothetical protein ANCDUO_27812, partial [Ancylostoma duodenale]